jgi:hypothetical protein
MKTFMTFVWIVIFGAAMTGCTTFSFNESGLRRACKSGVADYDDGSVNFHCNKRETNAHQEGGK